jgi:hypothetical protein
MGKRSPVRKPVAYYGKRAGTKRGDRHWLDPDGNKWDSRYEYLVYRAYKDAGKEVRRTDKGDTFSFVLPISRGQCGACGSTQVGQLRTYTPDIYVSSSSKEHEAVGYYVEAKGYLRAKERSLLRAFYKAHPDAPIRVLLQRDFPCGAASKRTGEKSCITQWFAKFLPKFKVALWQGAAPKDEHWRVGSVDQSKSAKRSAKVQRINGVS